MVLLQRLYRMKSRLPVMMTVMMIMMVFCCSRLPCRLPVPLEPQPDTCVASTALNHPLLQRTNGKVQRMPGDVLEVDLEGASWQPWTEPGNCSKYLTRFGRRLSPVLLVSLPCSGNTWLRYLLEGATGLFTGSRYFDDHLHHGGFLGEGVTMDKGRTLLHKTHGATLEPFTHDLLSRYLEVDPNLPTVLLIRDPARAVLSYYKLVKLIGGDRHRAEIPESKFRSEEFRDFVTDVTLLWEELAMDRLLWTTKPLYVLHYEDLTANPIHHLRLLLDFLSVPTDEGRLTCLAAHLDGSFRRNSSRAFDPFTQEEKLRFVQAVTRVNNLLRLLGYPLIPTP
ncbi:WSC domain-containing protein 1-like [Portunus trituberculatus]|uniref:WSC domain-containing protein 1-like n=1 Tax=Portunus trituberculatus TaxID=210409 RepID=UPI001E1D1D42|nr:WSC domain-containing protein 1-like [Portunus trituberculatus]